MNNLELLKPKIGVSDLFPPQEEKGLAKIVSFEIDEHDAKMANIRMLMNGQGGLFTVKKGNYVKLIVGGQLMMSDTDMERRSNMGFLQNVNGRVLIAGLGIGMILKPILDLENITEIVVIEKYQDVIDLVEPKLKHEKLKIVCADIFEYNNKGIGKFDTIYFDIWPTISTDNLPEIRKLEAKYRSNLNKDNPCNWMDSWMKEYLKKRRAKENRESRAHGWW